MKNPVKEKKPTQEPKRIARGGSWNYPEDGACVSDRWSYYEPRSRFSLVGFRIVSNK